MIESLIMKWCQESVTGSIASLPQSKTHYMYPKSIVIIYIDDMKIYFRMYLIRLISYSRS
jgi:hypothetical protein